MICAETGSGKTAAVMLPIIDKLLEQGIESHEGDIDGDWSARPEVLVVSPTRDLAIQLGTEALKFSGETKLKTAVYYGGTNVHIQRKHARGANILVCTPGRLKDMMTPKNGRPASLHLGAVNHFILDEADQLLDQGFLQDSREIHQAIVEQRTEADKDKASLQTVMLSATFEDSVQGLARSVLRKGYNFIAVGKVGAACRQVEQVFVQLAGETKKDLLQEEIKKCMMENSKGKILIFCNTKRFADFLGVWISEYLPKLGLVHLCYKLSKKDLRLKGQLQMHDNAR